MDKNLIILVVAVIILFIVFKMMNTMKSQGEIMKSQTEIMMAIAVKSGVMQPAEKATSRVDKRSPDGTPPASKTAVSLSAVQKRVMKLFEDEVPKTSSQLRTIYNKTETPQLSAKNFNNLLWNVKNNKGIINYEKFEDSDNVWGRSEWFEVKGEDARLQDDFFNRIKKQPTV